MTTLTHSRLPAHLRKYVVEQNYARYTPEDQAVWRFIMRQLKDYLTRHAHQSYLDGLAKTGITIERIPDISEIDRKLNAFGWGAVPVSGFIPPAAFMEFQSIGVLPIASDMRTLDHLQYTPAPDIVHEAAGHAPIIADPEYSDYLRQYGEVARHSIISKQDMDQYEAIRVLSDIKEDPRSSREDIARAEKRLQEVNESLTGVSEAALLSRMNWWTAEYGLIGDVKNPKIFGAGLLSSVGESRNCLRDNVKKIPLSVNCVDFTYDITEQQPQLFVAKDFRHLGEVLEDLAVRLSYRRGGVFGLDRAAEAKTVNTVQLNSGLQISGKLKNYLLQDDLPFYLQFEGPSQLSLGYREIEGQGVTQHAQGFSSPLGFFRNHRRCPSTYTDADLTNLALRKGERTRVQFESGVLVEGLLENWFHSDGKLVLMSWKDCRVTLGDQLLFDPAWGVYDMAVGSEVVSVFGGPADRGAYGETEDFVNKRVEVRVPSAAEERRYSLFREIRELRQGRPDPAVWRALSLKYLNSPEMPWLIGVELIELANLMNLSASDQATILQKLEGEKNPGARESVADGLRLSRLTT